MKSILKFLGIGNAFNAKDGNTSAFYKKDETLFLFDCGWTVFPTLIEKNVLEGVNTIYIAITHAHGDHSGSLSGLIDYCNYEIKVKPTLIVLDNKIVDLLGLQGVTTDDFSLVLLREKQQVGFNLPGLSIFIEAFQVVHSAKLLNCSYLVNFNGEKLYYSGDCNDIPNEVISQIDSIVELYQDTANFDYVGKQHLSLSKLEEKISINIRNKFFCMHLDKSFDRTKAVQIGFNVVERI